MLLLLQKYGRWLAGGAGIGLVILGLYFYLEGVNKTADVEFFESEGVQEEKEEIVVDIAGAVLNPGVHKLKPGARLIDLVDLAGGLTAKADKDWIDRNFNLARKLTDGEKIYVPEKGKEVLGEKAENGSSSLKSESASRQTNLVNINTASVSELETLPGIGPSFAQKIIDYRTLHNGFKSIEELKAVSGIGEKTFEKIKEKITI